MALSRISDAQSFAFFVSRANRLQVDVRRLQEQIASGRRLVANTVTPGQPRNSLRNSSEQAPARCSQLSRTTRRDPP